jgi:hypothetical protein
MPGLARAASALVPLAVCLAVGAAPAAAHADRWAVPRGGATAGDCAVEAPCTLAVAVGGASAGDRVVVTPGTHTLTASLSSPAAIEIVGQEGRPRPHIVTAPGFAGTLLSFKEGGALRHLGLEADGAGNDALTLEAGVAEDLIVTSGGGDAVKVVGTPEGVLLRDSVLHTGAGDGGYAALKVREGGGGGAVDLRNVTAMAPNGDARAVRCEISAGAAVLVNVLARGAAGDIDASSNGADCTATASNFRPAMSPGLASGASNQSAEPWFLDAAAGDYRPAAGSPTIDAGAVDPLLGGTDPAGCGRTLGAAPDIGAYEYAEPGSECAASPPESAGGGTPAQQREILDVIKGVPAPVIGSTVVVAPGRGKVLVRRPGSKRFRELEDAARIPVDSVVDASAGRVKLVSAITTGGTLQKGTFWGTRFVVRQSRRHGMTSLLMRGGDFSVCGAAASRSVATISRRRKPVRSLWGRDSGGRYRTHGQHSSATARGTKWLVADRCDGTLVRVTEGAVAVRDKVRHRTVLIEAGHSYLARKRR